MRLSFALLAATSLGMASLPGCGTTVRPHVRAGGSGPPTRLPGTRVNPRPDPERGDVDDSQPVVDQICRTQAMRAGWIATRYLRGADDCPESTDPENPYTAAVIERYSHRPIGSTMVVCADQAIPRQWVRDSNREVHTTCEGARVRDGVPTVMVIRRVSGS
jgi:hypothetical protein